MQEYGVKTFGDFLGERHIGDEAEIVRLLKEAWNAGVESACLYFGAMEGVDHGAQEALTEK